MSRSLLVRVLAVSVSAWVGFGCALVIDVDDERPENRCDVSASCRAGRCDPDLSMCVDDPDAPYEFVLSLVLPESDADGRPVLTTGVGPFVATAGDASADVLVRRPVPVTGRVRAGDLGAGPGVEADLVFTPRRTLPGPSPVGVTVRTLADRPGFDSRERAADYATQLVPGTTYEVEVQPRGEDAARHYPVRSSLELTTGQLYDVVLPTESVLVTGVVLDDRDEGQDGLEVRALDPSRGTLVSSIATTATNAAGEAGVFELHVDPSAGPWVLQIGAPPSYLESAAFPTVILDPAVLARGEDGRVRLRVPRPDTGVCLAGMVELPPSLGAGPVSAAVVTLRASELLDPETGLRGTYVVQRATGTTVAGAPSLGCSGAPLGPGEFEARVLPGEYEVEIRPLEDSLGVLLERTQVIGDVRRVFTMPARSVLSGLVQRSADEPLTDARVRALPLHVPVAGLPEGGVALLNRPSEALSDPTGQVSLPLDVGVYDLVVEPPVGSQFAWVVRPYFGIGGSTAGLREVFDVRTPVVVRGQAHFEDAGPLDGAEITAYALVDDAAGERRPVPIGRASAAPDGTFLLLLPPSLGVR